MIEQKTIFITGGAGFIANTLIERLIEANRIIAYDNFHRDTLSGSRFAGHPNLQVVRGDVLDLDLLTRSINGADIVVHAAAIAGIDTVVQDPVKTMRVNMLGTANALEAAKINGIQDRFVDFSTSEVFGSMAFRASEEQQTVSGSAGEARWTYAVSKLAGEHLSQAYYKQYSLPVVTVRPFNVYGPGQTGEGAMQIFITRALNNEPIHIAGDGSQIRAWCYVTDFVECLMRCLEDPNAIGHSFNVGNARAVITILGLAQTICRVLGSQSEISFVPPLSADIAIRIPSVEKSAEVLGFRATVDLEEGNRTYRGLVEDAGSIGVMTGIPLAAPDIQDEDIKAVVDVLRTGMLVQGEQVAAFEQEIADYLGVRHAVAVSSGTASLHVALMALGVGAGDEVIIPAFSFVATANVVEQLGARCIFVDVQADTLNVDPEAFGSAITDRTKAVIPVHEFGLACDIGRVMEIATEHGIFVIEDAACALGATENGHYVGGFGQIGSFSLHPRKAVTSGEGGVVTTNDEGLAARFRALRNHGFETRNDRVLLVAAGLNYRMTDFQAALVRGQFRRLENLILHRDKIAQTYIRTLRDHEWLVLPTTPKDKRHTWQTFHAILDASVDRDRIISELREAGIGSNYGAQCIPALDYYARAYGLDVQKLFPNAMRAHLHGIALPLYSGMSEAQAIIVAQALSSIAAATS